MDLKAISAVLDDAVNGGAIAGAVVAATDKTGAMFEIAAGRRSLDAPAPMQADSIFWVASMTKAVTTFAALQLVEAGRLSLDAPIGELLADLASPLVLEGFADDGKPITRPARTAITLRHLLTHTAGFSYEFANPVLGRYLKETGAPSAATGLLAGLRQPLMFDPGSAWEYSIGID